MRAMLKIIRKELKNMSGEIVFILLFQIAYFIIIRFMFEPGHIARQVSWFENLMLRTSSLMLFPYPALLLYSLYLENRTGTVYQAHLLPVKKHLLPLAKYLSVLAAMVVTTVGITVYALVYNYIVPRTDILVIFGGLLEFFCDPFISLCLVCAAWGIIQLIIRKRFVLGLMVVVAGFGIYKWLMMIAYNFFRYSVTSASSYFATLVYYFLITLGIGGVFSFIGFYFYEKFGEV